MRENGPVGNADASPTVRPVTFGKIEPDLAIRITKGIVQRESTIGRVEFQKVKTVLRCMARRHYQALRAGVPARPVRVVGVAHDQAVVTPPTRTA